MDKRMLLIKGTKFVLELGVMTVIEDAIHKHLPEPKTNLDKALYWVGGMAIASALSTLIVTQCLEDFGMRS